MLAQSDLQKVLRYDPETGLFVWLVRTSNRIRVGDVAGSRGHYGYLEIRVCKKLYGAHRLAWLYMTGAWPDEVDHRNGVRSDNRWLNLRDGTHAFNLQNEREARQHNQTGVLGVTPRAGKFRAQLCVNGKQRYLGTFPTAELAHAVYLEAKRTHHPGCTI